MLPIEIQSYAYGALFEHFLIKELFALNEYFRKDFRLFYLRTKDDAEIDIVIERPGKKDLLVEIKSTENVSEEHCRTLNRFLPDWDRPCEGQVWSRDPLQKKIEKTLCLPWQQAFKKIFE